MSIPNYACAVKYYSFYGKTLREALGRLAAWPGLDRVEPPDVPGIDLSRADDGDVIVSIVMYEVESELPLEFEG